MYLQRLKLLLDERPERDYQTDILLVDHPYFVDSSELANRLYSRFRHLFSGIDAIVLRFPTDPPPVEKLNVIARPFVRLWGQFPIFLLWNRDFRPFVRQVSDASDYDPFSGVPKDVLLAALREAELQSLLQTTGALIASDEQHVFVHPSGKIANFFIRAGNIQANRNNIDALYFWMNPHMRGVTSILVDNWSISSLAFSAARFRHRNDGIDCKVDILDHYLGRSSNDKQMLRDCLSRLTYQSSDTKILALTSVNASGRHYESLRSALQENGVSGEYFRYLSIYDFNLNTKTTPPSLCHLGAFKEKNGLRFLDKKEIVESRSRIKVDPRIYFPVVRLHETAHVRERHTRENKKFLDQFGELDLFRVHSMETGRGYHRRHHGIDLNVGPLLNEPAFCERLEAHLSTYDRVPDMIVSPSHANGIKLAHLCRAFYARRGQTPAIYAHNALDIGAKGRVRTALEETIERRLAEMDDSAAILIVDDVFVSGQTLVEFQRNLRDIFRYRGRVFYLVAVSRPEAKGIWDDHLYKLRFRTLPGRQGFLKDCSLHSLFDLVLPDWDKSRCPWCIELAVLRKIRRRLGPENLGHRLSQRIDLLSRAPGNGGMRSSLFNVAAMTADFRMNGGSHFSGEAISEAGAFAAVAGALQGMRTLPPEGNERQLGQWRFPVQTEIAWSEWFVDTYTDEILRSSLLRSIEPWELVPGEQSERSKFLRRLSALCSQRDSRDSRIVAEILLQVAAERLPYFVLSGRAKRNIDAFGYNFLVPIESDLETD